MIATITTTIQQYLEGFTYDLQEPRFTEPPFEDVYKNGKDRLFNFNFPWYVDVTTPAGVESLEDFKRMFILRFYTERIKAETFGLFKIRLNARLTQEMPRFRQLYETTLIDYDPIINQLYTDRTHDNLKGTFDERYNLKQNEKEDDRLLSSVDESGSGKRDTTDSGTRDYQGIKSDNPQTNFSGRDYAAEMDRGQDVTNNTQNETTSSTYNTERDDRTDITKDTNRDDTRDNKREDDRNVLFDRKGFVGTSMTDNIEKYRDSILNLNKWLCDVCDGIYPDRIYGGLGESRQSSLFGEYLGRGVTLSI